MINNSRKIRKGFSNLSEPAAKVAKVNGEDEAQNNCFSDAQVGDSDDEVSDDEVKNSKKIHYFSRDTPVPASEITVSAAKPKEAKTKNMRVYFGLQDPSNNVAAKESNKKPVKNVKGSMLITIAHVCVKDLHESLTKTEKFYGNCEKNLFLDPKSTNIDITGNNLWVKALGGGSIWKAEGEVQNFYKFKGNSDIFNGVKIRGTTFLINNISNDPNKPVYRLFGPNNFVIDDFNITSNDKDNETKVDLTYKQIIKTIGHLKSKYLIEDSQIAKLQLELLKNPGARRESILSPNSYPEFNEKSAVFDQIITFLDFLNCLMFIIEASAINTGIVTGLMLLQLIEKAEVNYEEAFNATNQGGVYPYANLDGKNQGTYSKRNLIIYNDFTRLSKEKQGKFKNAKDGEFDFSDGVYQITNEPNNELEYYQVKNKKIEKLNVNSSYIEELHSKKSTYFKILHISFKQYFLNYEESTSMKQYRKDPNYSPVALKEAILIKKWLIVNNIVNNKDETYESQTTKIKTSIKKLLTDYFVTRKPH